VWEEQLVTFVPVADDYRMMMHNRVALASLLLFAALEACSATNSSFAPSAPSSLNTNVPTSGGQPTPRRHTNATSATSITVSGKISALYSGGFTIYETSGCGYNAHMHVNLTSSTTMSGPTPAVGVTAQATGTGSCSAGISATAVTTSNVSTSGASASPSPIPLEPNNVAFASTITNIWSGGFTLAPQGSYGSLHVYTGSSALITGGTPKVGLYAEVKGPGPVTDYQASYVTLYTSAPGSVTVSGTAVAASSYGFTVSAGASYPAIPVLLNKSTIVAGASLVTGSPVKVTGVGSDATSITASQVVVSTPSPGPGVQATATPGPIAQTHILTADYLGSPDGTTSLAWSAVAPYLTWAQTAWQISAAVAATGIETQYYVDPNRTTSGTGDPLYTSDETTFAHDCSGNRVTDDYSGTTTQYVMNIEGSSMQALFASNVSENAARGQYNAIYEDDAGPLSEYIYTPFTAMPCSYTDAAWLSAGETLDQASSLPVIFNGLNALNGNNVSESTGLLTSSNTIGGNYEHCYSDDTTAKMSGWLWQAIENTELQVGAQNKLFECQLRNTGTASSQTDSRIYALASFLLTYNPATSVLWEAYTTPSGFHVQPEEQLIVLNPVGSAPTTIAGLQQNGGTYGRQYGQCYVAGKFVNSCAIIVNANTVAQPNPFPQYTHTLTLSGGGILDGGTLSTTGAAEPSSIPADEAAIVFP
jgi:hypothetical protein